MHSGITHDGTPYTKHTHMVMPDEADIGLTKLILVDLGQRSRGALTHHADFNPRWRGERTLACTLQSHHEHRTLSSAEARSACDPLTPFAAPGGRTLDCWGTCIYSRAGYSPPGGRVGQVICHSMHSGTQSGGMLAWVPQGELTTKPIYNIGYAWLL